MEQNSQVLSHPVPHKAGGHCGPVFLSPLSGPTECWVPETANTQNTRPGHVWAVTETGLRERWPHTVPWDQSFPGSQAGENTIMRSQRYSGVLCLLAPLNVWLERQMGRQMLAYLSVTYTRMYCSSEAERMPCDLRYLSTLWIANIFKLQLTACKQSANQELASPGHRISFRVTYKYEYFTIWMKQFMSSRNSDMHESHQIMMYLFLLITCLSFLTSNSSPHSVFSGCLLWKEKEKQIRKHKNPQLALDAFSGQRRELWLHTTGKCQKRTNSCKDRLESEP